MSLNPWAKRQTLYLFYDQNAWLYKIGITKRDVTQRAKEVDEATDGKLDGNVHIIHSVQLSKARMYEQWLLSVTMFLKVEHKGAGKHEWRRLPVIWRGVRWLMNFFWFIDRSWLSGSILAVVIILILKLWRIL